MEYNILLPSKPRVVSEDATKGIYEIDGLYRGYGHTLGNSLRRVILSSLPGAAVTKVKIEGVSHEFSTIPGVKEDVITILLNLKRLRFKMHSDEPQTVKLSVKGAKKVLGKDLKTPSQVEVVNKDSLIATLTDKSAKLELELVVERGLGYVPRETLQKSKMEVGTLALDAIFTPIRRVHYEVENMRVGERTDYNRLRFIIETDGSISPKEAFEKAIKILISQLEALVGFETEKPSEGLSSEDEEKILEEEKKKKKERPAEDPLKIRVEDLGLSSRTLHALSKAGVRTVGGLVKKREADLLAMEGIGKNAVQEIRRAIGAFGLILKE